MLVELSPTERETEPAVESFVVVGGEIVPVTADLLRGNVADSFEECCGLRSLSDTMTDYPRAKM